MRYKAFGSTGLQVSEMALGTWGMGGSGWDDYSEDTRLDAIRAAVECGVNFIDTAPAYNNGVAERFVGKAVKEMGVRDKVIIATKCGNDFINGAYVRNGSRDNILRECEESLRNLQTDHIDLYLIHWPVPGCYLSTWKVLEEIQKSGRTWACPTSLWGRWRGQANTGALRRTSPSIPWSAAAMRRRSNGRRSREWASWPTALLARAS